ncbi:MAG: PQ-loop repeat-containing protein [Alphaproteobacteria bacterium]|nr:PQ-loop repeat-containing protein [Alphaproteobacteria bacterium]
MRSVVALSLLFLYTVCEYAAYVPQMVKLIKTKSADDLSITSWLTWVLAGVCYLLYILLECPEAGVIFVASMNLIFLITVSVLTAYYQKPQKRVGKTRKKRRLVR